MLQWHHVKQCESTQDLARELWETHTSLAPLAVTAEVQWKGRGRFGREWISQKGNLHLSLALVLQSYEKNLSIRVAYLLQEVLQDLGLFSEIQGINDLVMPQGKIVGILIENFVRKQHPYPLTIIGIGLNCIPLMRQPFDRSTTSLSEYGINQMPQELAGKIVSRLLENLEIFTG